MLSSARLSPLNSSTTAVSSSSSSLSSLSSSSPSRPVQQVKSSRGSPSSSSSACWSCYWLVHFVVCLTPVCLLATPIAGTDGAKLIITPLQDTKSPNRTMWNSNSTDSLSDMAQGDQPPRNMDLMKLPPEWEAQSQGRTMYLQSVQGQFLQIKDDKVTGTNKEKPQYGVMAFFSHNGNVVIRSNYDKKMLCMDKSSALYMSETLSPDCYIKESHPSGSLSRNYEFIRYRRPEKRLFLAINCDPILGNNSDPNHNSARFNTLSLPKEKAEEVNQQIKKKSENGEMDEKCEAIDPQERQRQKKLRRREQREKRKQQRQKLRGRWCWNLYRMTKNRVDYLKKCYKKHPKQCTRNKKRCVCNILKKWLDKKDSKRAKRKCLAEKITKWVKKRQKEPNGVTILQAAKLLMPSYRGIARRMRTQKKAKHARRRKILSGTNTGQSPDDISPTPHSSSHPHRHEESRRGKRNKRRKSIKINPILEKYKNELFLPPTATQNLTQQPDSQKTSVSQGTPGNVNRAQTLSPQFIEELTSLSDKSRRRRRRRKRKHDRERHRRQRGQKTLLEPEDTTQRHVRDSWSLQSVTASPG